MSCEPFTVNITDEEISRLYRKLEDTALPSEDIVQDAGWDYGVDLAWVKEMRTAWMDSYDWRKAEREINSVPNFMTTIEDLKLHFVHVRSDRTDAIPIVLLHGWPGTFYEFYRILHPLANPEDRSKPAFHVVVPSIPGFAFSSASRRKGWTVKDSARVINSLMQDVLSYSKYMVQGGDWGSLIATHISTYPGVHIAHLNMCVVPPPSLIFYALLYLLPVWLGTSRIASWLLSKEDLRQLQRSKDFALRAGYFFTHATQPMQIGLAFNDSPIGLLIWIGSKYKEHIDPKHPLSRDELFTTLSIYFFTQSFATSLLPYNENSFKEPLPPVKEAYLGVSVFNHDILVMPKSWVKSYHGRKLVFHSVHSEGGHFPALDNPDGLVNDIRELVQVVSEIED